MGGAGARVYGHSLGKSISFSVGNEYKEHFLGVKTAGAVVMKSGNLNFLEPSGPLQTCNGTDLPSL